MYSILPRNVKNRVGFWGSTPDLAGPLPQTSSREGLFAFFGNRSFAPLALAICPTRTFWYTYRYPSFQISIFPSGLLLFNAWIRLEHWHQLLGYADAALRNDYAAHATATNSFLH